MKVSVVQQQAHVGHHPEGDAISGQTMETIKRG